MKKINLVNDKFAIVDDEDFEYLNQWNWSIKKSYNSFIAVRDQRSFNKRKMILMHREIMKVKDPKIQVIHLNGDCLDNRKENLYPGSKQDVNFSRKKNYHNKTFKGVTFRRSLGKYIAAISKDGIKYSLGTFFKAEEAAMVYDKAALELHGDIALTNKKQGLIEYNRLPDVKINFNIDKRGSSVTSPEDYEKLEIVIKKIIELKKNLTYVQISDLFKVSPDTLCEIAYRKRRLRMNKIEEILTVIKEKNL